MVLLALLGAGDGFTQFEKRRGGEHEREPLEELAAGSALAGGLLSALLRGLLRRSLMGLFEGL